MPGDAAKGGASPDILLWLTDMHVGGTTALWPPGMTGTDATPLPQNRIQEWLWSHWQRSWAAFHEWRSDRPYVLALGGDIIEGVHHRTTQVMDSDPAFHVAAAEYLLSPVARSAARCYVVRGTEVHVGPSSERALGDIVGAVAHPETGQRSAHEWDIEIAGVRVAMHHHMPTTSRKYLEASQLSIQLGNIQLNYARLGLPVPQVVLCGHRHVPGFYTDGRAAMGAGGCWQAKTNYGHKVVPRSLPLFGFMALDFHRPGCVPYWRDEFNFAPRAPEVA